jgi:hypothetical protein
MFIVEDRVEHIVERLESRVGAVEVFKLGAFHSLLSFLGKLRSGH